MSTSDSAGESLESILASIRKSLSEQSTDVLEEESAAPVGLAQDGAAADRGKGFFQSLPGDMEDAPQADAAAPGAAMPSAAPMPAPQPERAASLETPPAREPDPAPPAAAAADPPVPAGAQKDPLWFLSRPASSLDDAPPRPVSTTAKPAEPRRAEIVRGPLPPFFGSSAEAAKVEAVPVPGPSAPGAGVLPAAPPAVTPPPVAPPPVRASADTDLFRSSAPDPAPSWSRVANGGGAALDGVPVNGKASSIFGPAPADGRPGPADGSAQMQALEVMVAELLRPMLRRWLDENMPRLVSAALKAEAALMSERDPKKP